MKSSSRDKRKKSKREKLPIELLEQRERKEKGKLKRR